MPFSLIPSFAPSSSFFLINKNLGLSGHSGNRTRHTKDGTALNAKHTGHRFQVPVEIKNDKFIEGLEMCLL